MKGARRPRSTLFAAAFVVFLLVSFLFWIFPSPGAPAEEFSEQEAEERDYGMYSLRDNGEPASLVDVDGRTNRDYTQLQELYDRYQSAGLAILAFPCNQFGQQEPKSNAEIKKFATSKFGVTFPIFGKVDVNGPSAHFLWTWLKQQTDGRDVSWNFEKILVSRKGKPFKRYSSGTAPKDIEQDIVNLLDESE